MSTTGELARARLLLSSRSTGSLFVVAFVCGLLVVKISFLQAQLSSGVHLLNPLLVPPITAIYGQKWRSISTPIGDLAPGCLPRVQRPTTPATTATAPRRGRPTRRAPDGHLRRRRRDRMEPQQHDARRQGLPQPPVPLRFFRRPSSALFRRRRLSIFWWPRIPGGFFSTR